MLATDGFRVYRSGALSGLYLEWGLPETSMLTYTDIGLAEETATGVFAFNVTGESAVYASGNQITLPTLPLALPTNVVFSNVTDQS
ncbi:MAG: hypothetical protein R2751_16140 [Bacteroidales bacterium]